MKNAKGQGNMASFDIIDAAGHGYSRAWAERAYLVRLALIPAIVKLACLVAIFTLEYQDNFLRQALVMIPAFFTEGWLLAHVVRLFVLNERWPFAPTGSPEEDQRLMRERTRAVMGCIIMYVILKFAQTGAMEIIYTSSQTAAPPADPAQFNAAGMIAALVFLALLIWLFRFAFAYIPLAVNGTLGGYVRLLSGYKISFYLIGTWLLCFVPSLLVVASVSGLILSPYETVADVPAAMSFIVIAVQVVFDTTIAIVSTIAIAWALQDMSARAGGGR